MMTEILMAVEPQKEERDEKAVPAAFGKGSAPGVEPVPAEPLVLSAAEAELFRWVRIGAARVDDCDAYRVWARGGASVPRTSGTPHFEWARSGHESVPIGRIPSQGMVVSKFNSSLSHKK